MYQNALKKGKRYLVVVTDGYDMGVLSFTVNDIYVSDNNLRKDVEEAINKCKTKMAEQGLKPIIKIFSSLNDFIIR